MQQREQRLCKSCQIPGGDFRLIAIGIASALINGAEYCPGIVGIHKSTGTVIDRLPADRHIIGVHHAVDEANELPFGDQRSLPPAHFAKQ
ncbi:hypothetical protein D3C71_1616890 [compost metagenome]